MSIFRKLRALYRKGELDAEMAEEMRLHLEMQAERNVAAGMNLEEARYAALRQFGGVEQIKEQCREQRAWGWLEQWLQDLRYAGRQLRKEPGFAVVAVLSLALGIGATTAIFSALDRTLFRTLPVSNPHEIVRFHWLAGQKGARPPQTEDGRERVDPETGRRSGEVFSFATFERFRAQQHPMFAEVFAFTRPPRFTLEIDGQVDSANGQVVSGGYYTGLGGTAMLGRTILPGDDQPGAAAVTVISYRCWQRFFGGDPAVVGKVITVNKSPVLVIGVMASDFVDPISVYGEQPFTFALAQLPLLEPDLETKKQPDYWWLRIMGRLQPGVTVEQAAASLQSGLQVSTLEGLTEKNDPPLLRLSPGGHGLIDGRKDQARPLFVLVALASLVLVTACANVANLQLARGATRQREIAVRLALGASRRRLILQLLTESVLLALIGAVLGVIFAAWGALTLVGLHGFDPFDVRVLAFAAAVAILTVAIFGLAPAFQSTRLDISQQFQGGSRQLGRGARSRLSRTLMVVQVSISLVLLVGAGLFARTLHKLETVEVGFNRSQLILFSLDAATVGYKPEQFAALHASVRDKLATLPAVRSVSYSFTPILNGSAGQRWRIEVPGYRGSVEGEAAKVNAVGTNFFATLEIPLLIGRVIDERDGVSTSQVAVINQALAKKYFEDESPVGRHITVKGDREIIGVVRDVKDAGLRDAVLPTVYVPFASDASGQASFAVRTTGEPGAVAASLRQAVREIEANLPLRGLTTQDQAIERMLGSERNFASLSGFFGLAALALACVGLYGLISYAVVRRTGEIGLRMALGALPGQVLRLVLRESLTLVGIGVAVGIGIATAVTRLIATMLYEVSPADPLTISVVATGLIVLGVTTCWIPARRAAKVDPMVALRSE